MKTSNRWLSIFTGILCLAFLSPAAAQDAPPTGPGASSFGSLLSHDPEDAAIQLRTIQQRATGADALFPNPPFQTFRERVVATQQRLYDVRHIKTGLALNSAFQGLSDALPGEEKFGAASDMDLIVAWELINRGQPTRGRIYCGLEGRWEYGIPGPSDLGPASLGSSIETANSYAAYSPTYIVRNLFWRQGSPEAGWGYRIGHITPEQVFSTSSRLSPISTFLTVAGTRPYANALSDSGLGAVVGWAPFDRVRIGGIVSDANANRLQWALGSGEVYKALEIQAKLWPKTETGVWSKITFWHNDGNSDGQPINGMTGREGWGVFVIHEHELTADGRAVAILRWGKCSNRSALFEEQVGVHLVLDDPCVPFVRHLEDDAWGVAFNWVDSSAAGSRDEYDLEAFYRFPLFPNTDLSFLYQSIFRPALERSIDHASAISIRLASSY